MKSSGTIYDAIRAARDAGVVHCGASARRSPQLSELAREFGLSPIAFKEIDTLSARRLVKQILHADLAHHAEIMPAARADELAAKFLDEFGAAARCYTNGTFHETKSGRSGITWTPATGATFDTGVLVIGLQRSGCIWVEDED